MKRNTNNLIIALGVFLFLGSTAQGVFSESENGTVEVTATGVGVTVLDAQKDAVRQAVQQVVGLYVDAETRIKNEKIIYDQVLSISSGFVSSQTEIVRPHKRLSDDLFETTIKAVVKKTDVAKGLNNAQISFPIDAKDAWAEAFSRLQNAQDGRRLLEKYWPEVSLKLLRARLVDDGGRPITGACKPTIKEDGNSGLVWCAWNIEVFYDRAAYFEEVAPRLQKIFDAICIRKAGERSTRKTPSKVGSAPIAILGTPVQWDHAWSELPVQSQQNEFNLAVMLTSDKAKFLQSAKFYVLDVNPYAKILVDAVIGNVLGVKLIGSDNSTLLADKLSLDHTYLVYRDVQISKSEHHIPIAGNSIKLAGKGPLWPSDNAYVTDMWLIAPEFQLWSNGFGITDRILLRYETQLHPDTLKDLKELQLSFIHQKPLN